MNFSVTTSHMSIRSCNPLSMISCTFAPSTSVSSHPSPQTKKKPSQARETRTIALNANVHLRLGRMGDRVAAELDVGAGYGVSMHVHVFIRDVLEGGRLTW